MSDIRIKAYPVGELETNCYMIYRKGQNKMVIVDPGDNGMFLLNKCWELSMTPEVILLTHGHFDHILGVEDIKRAFPEVKVVAGEEEKEMLEDPALNLSADYGRPCKVDADQYVKDGDILSFAGISFQVIYTPGHTSGSVCYLIEEEEALISGDTLFLESLGRTDFPTGSQSMIVKSIKERLFPLPEDTLVYPGHGEITSIGHEKVKNPVAFYR